MSLSYTALEQQIIAAFVLGFNYDNADSEIEDNATALSIKELATHTNLSISCTKGVVGSLVKKGLLINWDEPDMEYSLHITENGIREYYNNTSKTLDMR